MAGNCGAGPPVCLGLAKDSCLALCIVHAFTCILVTLQRKSDGRYIQMYKIERVLCGYRRCLVYICFVTDTSVFQACLRRLEKACHQS